MTPSGTAVRGGGAVSVIRRAVLNYRRYLVNSLFVSTITPLLYLLALGVGLGTLVDGRGGAVTLGTTYLAYIAPALMAATAMEIGAGESTFPVISGFEWDQTYIAMYATPLTPGQILRGTIGWIGLRMLSVSAIFYLIVVAFGAVHTWQSVLAIPLAAFGGLAICVPLVALTGHLRKDAALNFITRFLLTPMMLFAGTFYEVSSLPRWGEVIAWVTPLWHTNELVRWVSLGPLHLESGVASLSAGMVALHLGYLGALIVVGYLVASRIWHRRLVV